MYSSATLSPQQPQSFWLKRILQKPLQSVFSKIKIDNRDTAIQICKLVPSQCPFERDIKVLGHTLFHLPPLCKLNPAYDELVALRFQALSFLADQCGEDITPFCS